MKNRKNVLIDDIAAQTYSGSAIHPTVTVKDGAATLTETTHYRQQHSG